jgi:predicted enzyme related to lactoylglutathione lyase
MSSGASCGLTKQRKCDERISMAYVNVLPSLHVSAFDETVAWYERLFGREPDRRPMDGDVEWQLTPTGGLQIFRNPEHPSTTTVILGLDDLDAEVEQLRGRRIDAEPYEVASGQFRLAELTDPAGNTVILSEAKS